MGSHLHSLTDFIILTNIYMCYLLLIIRKTVKECKWDPIKLIFMYYNVCTAFLSFFFCIYWPDDGPLRPKLVANSNIAINII